MTAITDATTNVKATTDAREDTASSPDVLLNLSALVPHLRAANRSPNTIRGYVEVVEKFDACLAAQGDAAGGRQHPA